MHQHGCRRTPRRCRRRAADRGSCVNVRRRPDRVVHAEPHEPAKQQVVIQLLHQLPLAADRVQGLQQQGPQQLLRRNRRPAEVRVQRAEPRRDPLQGAVRDLADRRAADDPRHALLQRDVAEHRSWLLVGSTHRGGSLRRWEHRSTSGSICRSPWRLLFQQPARTGELRLAHRTSILLARNLYFALNSAVGFRTFSISAAMACK